MSETCPVCGTPGRIVGSDEGTQHFEAARGVRVDEGLRLTETPIVTGDANRSRTRATYVALTPPDPAAPLEFGGSLANVRVLGHPIEDVIRWKAEYDMQRPAPPSDPAAPLPFEPYAETLSEACSALADRLDRLFELGGPAEAVSVSSIVRHFGEHWTDAIAGQVAALATPAPEEADHE